MYAIELELSLKREIFFVWPGRDPSLFLSLSLSLSLSLFLSLSLSVRWGEAFARPRDTYGGVIKIHVAFGYTERAILTPHRLGAYFAARRVACVAE